MWCSSAEHPAPRGRGFTLIELLVVICVVALLAVKLAQWMLYYQERAERAAMEAVVAAMQTGLMLHAAALFIRGGGAEINRLAGRNPMDFLAERPRSYLGAYAAAPQESELGGAWYFDTTEGILVYRPQRTRYLIPGPGGETEIRFRVHADWGEVQIGPEQPGASGLRGLNVAPVRPYRWFEDEAPALSVY